MLLTGGRGCASRTGHSDGKSVRSTGRHAAAGQCARQFVGLAAATVRLQGWPTEMKAGFSVRKRVLAKLRMRLAGSVGRGVQCIGFQAANGIEAAA